MRSNGLLTRSWLVLCCIALTVPAMGQNLQFGVKGGVPITRFFDTSFVSHFPHSGGIQYSSSIRRFVVGLSAEWLGHRGIGIEVDAEYRRTGYVHVDNNPSPLFGTSGIESFTVRGSCWDFPVFAKYRFKSPRGLFLSLGYSARYVGPVSARGTVVLTDIFGYTSTSQISTNEPEDLSTRFFSGPAAAVGAELGRGRLKFAPELRYTYWVGDTTNENNRGLLLHSNQIEVLLGLVFRR